VPNRFTPIQAGTDQSQQLAMINKNFSELDAESTKKLFYDSTGTPSIFIGIQQDGSSAIRVSKPGVDVSNATPDQLAFNSAQNIFKIVRVMTLTNTYAYSGAGAFGQKTVQIAHGLGFTPAYNAFGTFDAGLVSASANRFALPYSFSIAGGSNPNFSATVFVDDTYVYFNFQIINISATYTYTNIAKVYLMQESIA
jgi:hypothetical protein